MLAPLRRFGLPAVLFSAAALFSACALLTGCALSPAATPTAQTFTIFATGTVPPAAVVASGSPLASPTRLCAVANAFATPVCASALVLFAIACGPVR